ncbi:MAG: polysaccharide deacetylase family protein [Lachnospiraceae bacterium]|nr:polysaccharide deacetylase family protein [Lachnospiraceae bacterium]
MIHAILTIDDIASANTPAIVDYLNEKGITALMFAVGENVERYYENAIYALQHGMIVGNHSYSHPAFSEITMAEAEGEIAKNEALLDRLYKDAGIERKYRPFRFPYGNRGGANAAALQEYFRKNGFDKLKDTQIPYAFWKEQGLDRNIDTLWTFDFAEYRIRPDSGFTVEDVWARINNEAPLEGAALLSDPGSHILLLHAHDETDAMVPGYYRLFIDHLLEKGVVFDVPEFIPSLRD